MRSAQLQSLRPPGQNLPVIAWAIQRHHIFENVGMPVWHGVADNRQTLKLCCLQAQESASQTQQAAPAASEAESGPTSSLSPSNAASGASHTPKHPASQGAAEPTPSSRALTTPSGDSEVDSPTGRGVQRLARSGIVSRSLAGGRWTPHIRDADEVGLLRLKLLQCCSMCFVSI